MSGNQKRINELSVVIPVRDKDVWRLKEVIKRLDSELVREIIIVDYCSDPSIELKADVPEFEKVKVIRYDKPTMWNKAHALNIGFKNAKSDYIMTLDADILLGPDFFERVGEYIKPNNFIYTNKVKRIEPEDLSGDWEKNLGRSKKWSNNYNVLQEVNNTATGGFQIFPKKFMLDIRGIDENLVYYGGIDNITVIEAKRQGLDTITLNDTILHLEHPEIKEGNLPKEQREVASMLRKDRMRLMYQLLDFCHDKNSGEFGSLKSPNDSIVQNQILQYLNGLAIENSHEIPGDTKIMIAVMNNSFNLPQRFVQSLFNLYDYTQQYFPNSEIHYIGSSQVNEMRNRSIQKAINNDYDYLVMLDVDHDYSPDFILKMIGRGRDFITGCTKRRTKPYTPTQYHKYKIPLMTEDNYVYTDGNDGVIKIEVSGPVGMLMKVEALKELDIPYFEMDYSYHEMYLERSETENWTFYPKRQNLPLGGDYNFCRQLKEKGFSLWLDTSIHFPHFINGTIDGIGNPENKQEKVINLE